MAGILARHVRPRCNPSMKWGVADMADRRPEDMSGGQAQRVAIARALVGPRRLLLADEPTGALDSNAGMTILEVLRTRADRGAAVLLVPLMSLASPPGPTARCF